MFWEIFFSGFGLEVICSLTFVIMFLPKKRQRTALGRDDLYDDHKLEEMMTSRQRYFSTDRGRYTTGYVDRLQHQQYSAADRDKYRGQDRHRQKPSYQGITTSSLLRLYWVTSFSTSGFHRPLGVSVPSSIHQKLSHKYLPHHGVQETPHFYQPYYTGKKIL